MTDQNRAADAPVLSILIVTYRNPELTRACLESVFREAPAVGHEVLVVDNASGDGTAEMIAAEFPQVRLYAEDVNLGFAGANNYAAQLALGEYLLLLNPDTLVHEDALGRLLEFAKRRPGAGIVGGRTLAPSGELNPSSCWGPPSLWSALCFATGASSVMKGNRLLDPESLGTWQRSSEREVGVVTGCLLLCAKALWEELGGFDERFFMYGEDADLSLRAHTLGYRPAITPRSTITHVVGASSNLDGRKMTRVMQARSTIFLKHWGQAGSWAGIALLMAGAGLRAAGSRLVARLTGKVRGHIWRDVWANRVEWKAGYPAVTARARQPVDR